MRCGGALVGLGLVALLLPILSTAARGQAAHGILFRVPDKPDPRGTYLFYLHGRIVEDLGANAASPEYGGYEYSAIVGIAVAWARGERN